MILRTLVVMSAALLCADRVHAATRTVVLSGQQAPGAPAGANYTRFHSTSTAPVGPALNNSGRVSFAAEAMINAGTTYTGLWSDAPGALALIARSGAQAPGTSIGTTFNSFGESLVSEGGRTMFDASLIAPNTSNGGVWSDASGALSLLGRKGSAAPGAGGANFRAFYTPSLSDSGQTAFRALLTGAGVTAGVNDVGIWSEEPGGLTLMARAGSVAPGATAGAVFDGFPGAPIAINSSGRIAFKGFLSGTGIDDENHMGIWAEQSGGLELMARQGDFIPSIGARLEFVSDPSLDRNGRVAFLSVLTGVPVSTNSAVMTAAGGSLAVVARRGSPAPGMGTGVNFSGFGDVQLNGEGQVAFSSILTGAGVTSANDSSLWSTSGSGLGLAAREGAHAPGAAAGQNFSSFIEPAFNSAGQLAFTATLTGTGITPTNDRGVWAEGLDGSLRLVAREGDALEVSPGATRTISEVYFAGGFNTEDGRRVGFNDFGEVAFLAKFTDGSSGLFVSDVATALSGDFNGDGDVDGADFLTWQRGLGRMDTGLPNNGDANADGNVNAADLAVWKTKFGTTPAANIAATAIPEPGAIMLALLGCAGLLRRV